MSGKQVRAAHIEENHLSYLRGRKKMYKSELKLFPMLDDLESDPLEPDSVAEFNEDLLRDRFRWLLTFYQLIDGQVLLSYWRTQDPTTIERAAFPDESWEEFSQHSMMLGLVMLRDEIKYLEYMKQLKDSLFSRVRIGEPVLMIGPTSGAEVEAIHASRATPYFISNPEEPHALQAESRLLSDRVPFESLTFEEALKSTTPFRYIVLSRYLTDARAIVKTAYNLTGMYGYIACPADCVPCVEEMELLNMYQVDRFNKEVAIFYKFPGLPQFVGD